MKQYGKIFKIIKHKNTIRTRITIEIQTTIHRLCTHFFPFLFWSMVTNKNDSDCGKMQERNDGRRNQMKIEYNSIVINTSKLLLFWSRRFLGFDFVDTYITEIACCWFTLSQNIWQSIYREHGTNASGLPTVNDPHLDMSVAKKRIFCSFFGSRMK